MFRVCLQSASGPRRRSPGRRPDVDGTNALGVPEVFGIEEIDAWRAWVLIGDPQFVRLASVVHSSHGAEGREPVVWPTNRWFDAECSRSCKQLPGDQCSCGLYAAKTLEQLENQSYRSYHEIPDRAIGIVGMAGKVIEGGQGWRAEKGRVKKLWVPYDCWEYVEPLQEAYNVPVGFCVIEGPKVRLVDLDASDDEWPTTEDVG